MSSRRSKRTDDKYVTQKFCDERFDRIVEKIDKMKGDILSAVSQKQSMSWQAKAAIVTSVIMSVTSIVVAYIQFLA